MPDPSIPQVDSNLHNAAAAEAMVNRATESEQRKVEKDKRENSRRARRVDNEESQVTEITETDQADALPLSSENENQKRQSQTDLFMDPKRAPKTEDVLESKFEIKDEPVEDQDGNKSDEADGTDYEDAIQPVPPIGRRIDEEQ